jgi:hypothetical protein
LAAAAANVLLLSASYIRGRAETSLQAQVTTLRDNLGTLTELRTERQSQLEADLAAAEARAQAAEAAMPPVETALDVFDLAYAVAGDDGAIVVLSVRRETSELKQTSIGLVELKTHRVTAVAGFDACLHYLGLLESQGAGLGLAGVLIQPDQAECSADVLTLGRP